MYLNILKISTYPSTETDSERTFDDIRPAFTNFQCLNDPGYSLSEINTTIDAVKFCCWTEKI